jgi:hypothetical protein
MQDENEDEDFEGKYWYGEVGYTLRRSRWERERGTPEEEGLVAFVASGCSIEDITERLYYELLARHLDMAPDGEYQLGTPAEAAAVIGPELAARMLRLRNAEPIAFGPFPFD